VSTRSLNLACLCNVFATSSPSSVSRSFPGPPNLLHSPSIALLFRPISAQPNPTGLSNVPHSHPPVPLVHSSQLSHPLLNARVFQLNNRFERLRFRPYKRSKVYSERIARVDSEVYSDCVGGRAVEGRGDGFVRELVGALDGSREEGEGRRTRRPAQDRNPRVPPLQIGMSARSKLPNLSLSSGRTCRS
jgi:hypothetical protein